MAVAAFEKQIAIGPNKKASKSSAAATLSDAFDQILVMRGRKCDRATNDT